MTPLEELIEAAAYAFAEAFARGDPEAAERYAALAFFLSDYRQLREVGRA